MRLRQPGCNTEAAVSFSLMLSARFTELPLSVALSATSAARRLYRAVQCPKIARRVFTADWRYLFRPSTINAVRPLVVVSVLRSLLRGDSRTIGNPPGGLASRATLSADRLRVLSPSLSFFMIARGEKCDRVTATIFHAEHRRPSPYTPAICSSNRTKQRFSSLVSGVSRMSRRR